MKAIRFITVLVAALTAFSATAATAATARHFEGTVVSVNRDANTFRLNDVERGTVRVKVTRNTRFERIDGLSGLKAGAKNIEATVKRKDGVWVAVSVERSGGGGNHGGGGADDRGGHDRGDDNPSGSVR
jgi:uncharacterized membrane protein YgcG